MVPGHLRKPQKQVLSDTYSFLPWSRSWNPRQDFPALPCSRSHEQYPMWKCPSLYLEEKSQRPRDAKKSLNKQVLLSFPLFVTTEPYLCVFLANLSMTVHVPSNLSIKIHKITCSFGSSFPYEGARVTLNLISLYAYSSFCCRGPSHEPEMGRKAISSPLYHWENHKPSSILTGALVAVISEKLSCFLSEWLLQSHLSSWLSLLLLFPLSTLLSRITSATS